MNLYEQICVVAKEKGYSINRLEKECGFARSYISKFKTITPGTDKIQKICEVLGVSVEYLTTGKEMNMPEFEPEHLELIRLYSKLNEEQKKTVLTMLRSLAPEN